MLTNWQWLYSEYWRIRNFQIKCNTISMSTN